MVKQNKIKISPTSLKGEVKIPPSKSLSHRALIAAALSNGTSKITNVVFSNDVTATIHALESMGAKFTIDNSTVLVTGVKKIKQPHKAIYCNESGSTLRFIIPLLSLSNKVVHITGEPSLINRPQSIYEKIFKEDNSKFEVDGTTITIKGSLTARDYYIDGNVSSQFFSGLMFALPLLKGNSNIIFTSKLESKSYIDLTIDILSKFGIIIRELDNGYFIEGNQQYTSHDYEVEGDYSQAAFYLVAGILGGVIKSTGLELDSIQGDKHIVEVIKQVQGHIIHMENGYITTKSESFGTIVDIGDCPDLGPIIALLLSLSKGKSRIINAERLRYKESDRIESTVTTLKKLGANISVEDNDIIIHGRKSLNGGVEVDSYNDHRIAMMVCIAALSCKNEVILTGVKSINKSYPSFLEDYVSVGGIIE